MIRKSQSNQHVAGKILSQEGFGMNDAVKSMDAVACGRGKFEWPLTTLASPYRDQSHLSF